MIAPTPITPDLAARFLLADRTPAGAIVDDCGLARALLTALLARGLLAGHAPPDFDAVRRAYGRRHTVAATLH